MDFFGVRFSLLSLFITFTHSKVRVPCSTRLPYDYSNKMSDAVALNGEGNEEELRDDADDTISTSTLRLMLSQQELEGDGEISGATERVPLWLALTKCLAGLGLMYGPLFGLALSFSMTNTTLGRLLGAACLSVSLGTFSWLMCGLIGRCRRDPACRDTFILLLQCGLFLVVTGATFFGSVFLQGMFAMYAFGDYSSLDESPGWLWTTLLLLDLQFVVCTCVYVIGDMYMKLLESRPSIEGATGVCHLAPYFFAYCTILFGATGTMVGFAALAFWTAISPIPAVAWMAPVSMLVVHAWIRSTGVDRMCACWMWISQRRSTISVAAQFELANSSMEKDGAFATATDAFHMDDRTETETTISSEVV
jgi:hypothetical protein